MEFFKKKYISQVDRLRLAIFEDFLEKILTFLIEGSKFVNKLIKV
jgi:hypothetical protein